MKKWLFTIILVLLTVSVLADSLVLQDERVYENGAFTVDVKAVNNEITNIDSAKFMVSITSKLSKNDLVSLSFADTEDWKWVYTDPLYYGTSESNLAPNQKVSFEIILEPKEGAATGSQIVKTTFRSKSTGESVDVPLDVYIKTGHVASYSPDIKATIILDNIVDPRKDNIVNIEFENYNARSYGDEDILLTLNSKLLGKREVYTSLDGTTSDIMGKKQIKIPLNLESDHAPEHDRITGYFEIAGEKYEIAALDFEVLDYTDKFIEDVATQDSFLKTKKTITYTNDGNSKRKQLIQIPTTFFKRFFTSTNPDAKVTTDVDKKRYLEWEADLAPGETFVVYTTVSYIWLFLVLFFAVLLFIYQYVSQSPIIVKKEAFNIETAEGGISEMKVNVIIKNTSTRPIPAISVIDKVPNIVDVLNQFDVGTLRPAKIVKKEGSTLIQWDIPEIDPYEERILSYKIKSKLSILGDFTLPVANVKYPKGKRKIVVCSNTVMVQA